MIADDLQELLVPIETLTPLHHNPRRGNVNAIKASLTQFGQLKPLVVNQDGQILAGNHTHAAAVQLGWDHIAAITVNLTLEEAQAFAIADNHTSDLSRWDNKELTTMLTNISNNNTQLLEATSFTPEDLQTLLQTTDNPAAFQPPEKDNTEQGQGNCPTCQRPL
jgi:ParB-like chromosome segregation protein Spo0J